MSQPHGGVPEAIKQIQDGFFLLVRPKNDQVFWKVKVPELVR